MAILKRKRLAGARPLRCATGPPGFRTIRIVNVARTAVACRAILLSARGQRAGRMEQNNSYFLTSATPSCFLFAKSIDFGKQNKQMGDEFFERSKIRPKFDELVG